MTALYDTIGRNYATLRRPDPRIAASIHRALGDAERVLNVGAGAGSYEPTDRPVVAVEPSAEMIRQRPAHAAPVVQASAEAMPFEDAAFDASMAILTVHHWQDREAGLHEMRRVTRGRIVLLTVDPAVQTFWLNDYVPELSRTSRARMPSAQELEAWLGPTRTEVVPIPHDCTDGFLCAYWRRPSAYLDADVRAAISVFAELGDVAAPLARLAQDLESGDWAGRYRHLLQEEQQDFGYRIVVAEAHPPL